MYEWKTFSETSFPEKEELYSNLNMEDIMNVECRLHACEKSL